MPYHITEVNYGDESKLGNRVEDGPQQGQIRR